MKLKSTIILASLAAAFAIPAHSAPLKNFDADKSGDVSLEEFVAKRVEMRIAQLKKQGKTDEEIEEASARIKKNNTNIFKRADANGDGLLDQAELDVATTPAKKKKQES